MPLVHVSGFIDETELDEIAEWLDTIEDPPASLVVLIEHLLMWKMPT